MTGAGPAAAGDLAADVVVVGGGLGGCAAALAAAAAGIRVVLTEETDRVGGQVTSQLVSALDEHAAVEEFPGSASYRGFRTALRAAYGGVVNPGGGWVSRLCVEPRVAGRVLTGLLRQRGVTVLTGVRPVAAGVDDGVLRTVVLDDGTVLRAPIFADATELGDLLPLAGAPWIVGSEGPLHSEEHGLRAADPRAMQSFTWCAVLEHVPGARFDPVPRPASGDRWDDRYGLDVAGWDGTVHRYRMFARGPDGRLPFWTYRRLSRRPDVMVLNWVSHDYADASLLDDPVRARRESREQTLGFVHWLQTRVPRDDGHGQGYPSLRLAPEVAGTPDGLAAAPYVRESRRLLGSRPVTGRDLAPLHGRARAAPVADTVGVAHYHLDLHPRVGAPGTVYAPTAPFQVPLRALVADRPSGLLAAAKNLGATQVAASAYRVHSGEWAVGEAAGTLAAYCVSHRLTPAAVRDDTRHVLGVQVALVLRGTALAWSLGVTEEDPDFAAVQLLAAAGGLAGRRLEDLAVAPDARADEADRTALHAAAVRVARCRGRCAPLPTAAPSDASWREAVRHHADLLHIPSRPRSLL